MDKILSYLRSQYHGKIALALTALLGADYAGLFDKALSTTSEAASQPSAAQQSWTAIVMKIVVILVTAGMAYYANKTKTIAMPSGATAVVPTAPVNVTHVG